jgi:hypothetical protein
MLSLKSTICDVLLEAAATREQSTLGHYLVKLMSYNFAGYFFGVLHAGFGVDRAGTAHVSPFRRTQKIGDSSGVSAQLGACSYAWKEKWLGVSNILLQKKGRLLLRSC